MLDLSYWIFIYSFNGHFRQKLKIVRMDYKQTFIGWISVEGPIKRYYDATSNKYSEPSFYVYTYHSSGQSLHHFMEGAIPSTLKTHQIVSLPLDRSARRGETGTCRGVVGSTHKDYSYK